MFFLTVWRSGSRLHQIDTHWPSEQISPFPHVVVPQQFGLLGGQHAPFPVSTLPCGQHTSVLAAEITATRDVGQHFLLPGAPAIVTQPSPFLQQVLPPEAAQQFDFAQHSVPHFTAGALHPQMPFAHFSVALSQHLLLVAVKQHDVPGLQHTAPTAPRLPFRQMLSPALQQVLLFGDPQNCPGLQQAFPHFVSSLLQGWPPQGPPGAL